MAIHQSLFNIPNSRWAWGIYFVWTLLLAVLAFENLRTHRFLDGWDDRDMMAETAAASQNLGAMFSKTRALPIRPPNDIVLIAAYRIDRDNPVVYHALQIGLHVLASLLLARVFFKLGADIELSWMSASLFLVNPAHFRAVHWINTIHYEIALIYGLICLLNFVAYIKTSRRSALYISTGALAAAIFAHPSAVSIAAFCAYIAWQKTQSAKRAFKSAWPLLLCASLSGWGAHAISPHSVQDHGFFAAFELSRIFENVFWYLGRLWSSAIWLTRATTSTEAYPWEIGIGCVYALAAFALYRKGLFPAAHWGIWIMFAVLPFVNTLPYRLAFGPSRHLYFASIGVAFLLAWTLRTTITHQNIALNRTARRCVLVVGYLALCCASIVSLRKAEALSIYFGGRGYAFRLNEDPQNARRAAELFERAILHAPDLVPIDAYKRLLGMGLLFGNPYRHIIPDMQSGHPDNAFIPLWKAIANLAEAEPGRWMQHERLIWNAVSQVQDTEGARGEAAVWIHNLAGHYFEKRQYPHVIALCEMALRFNPDYPLARENLEKAHRALAESRSKN